MIDNEFHFIARNTLYARKFTGDSLSVSEMEDLLWSEEFKKCTYQKDVFHFFLQSEQKMLLCYNLFKTDTFLPVFWEALKKSPMLSPRRFFSPGWWWL